MPKLYEYFGLIILFYSNEHNPVHIHCKHENEESRAELIFENGKFKKILIQEVKGKDPLNKNDLKKFIKLTEIYRDDIVRKWIDFFVYNKEIACEKITKKL